MDPLDYDVVVIGGGPGGLSGALYLARFRRRVLVIDEGHSRAIKIPRSHNMPGYPDGVAGAELVAAIRRQAARYGAEFAAGHATSQHRTPQGFLVHWGDGKQVTARILLLATGASDIEPPMPYFTDAMRSGALRYCPVCDGYEVIGQTVGVLADSDAGGKEALYLRNFTDRLTIFPTSADVQFSAHRHQQLAEAGVRVVGEPVGSIRQWSGAVIVRHGEEESRVDCLYSTLGMRIHSELVPQADRDDDGYLLTDRHRKTSIDGLYAVGDVSQGLNQISVALGDSAIAAAAIHLALGRAW